MKKYTLRFVSIISLFVTVLACAQTTESVASDKVPANAVSEAQTENADSLEEKKKAAAAEKASLPKPYDANENAESRIAELVKQAQAENKNIILQAGGNWCIWCLRFNDFVQKTPELKEVVEENFLYYHLNYSPENKNEKVFARYDNPGAKFGYPVFVVLDKTGKMIHTQDSAVLEEGKGYSTQKVKDFFTKWSPK